MMSEQNICLWQYILIIALTIVSFSCQKESTLKEAYIDVELSQLFDEFVTEGLERGVIIDFVNTPVEGFLDSSLDSSITGQCQHDSDSPDRVVISRSYWDRVSQMQREFLVFHELGHCYLKRSHLDEKNLDGECTSIMHSNASVCKNVYSAHTRSRYLDELFNSSK